MMFFTTQNQTEIFEEEEDELGIDDALLGELDDEDLIDDEVLLEEELPPALKESDFGSEDDEDPLKEDAGKLFGEDDEEEEDMDYDSFDDHDEM